MHRLPRTTRRSGLGAALAVGLGVGLAGAGCSPGSLDPTPDDPTITPSGAATASDGGEPTADPDPDVAVLDDAAQAVSAAHHVVRENLRVHPDQRAVLVPLERLHRVHARDLGGLRETTGRAADRSESPRQVLARVATEEVALQRTLVRASARAESGALGQLLASMAAAVAQHRTTPTGGAP